MTKKTTDRISKMQQTGVEFSARDLLMYPVENMTTDEVHFAWSILDILEKTSKARKGELRDRLLDDAASMGTVTDKGHHRLELPLGEVTGERRQGKPKLNEDTVRRLLEARGVDPKKVFKRRIVEQFDLAAFKKLAADDLISDDDYEAVYETQDVKWALKVVKPDFLPKSLGKAKCTR